MIANASRQQRAALYPFGHLHSWVWIPRSAAAFENPRTGELVAVDIGLCQRCGVLVWGPGEQLDAELWAKRTLEVINEHGETEEP